MTMPKCRPGDLAVVVSAKHRCNLGKIVEIVRLHGRGHLVPNHWPDPVWWVTSAVKMKWTFGGEVYRRRAGPVPDFKLQPIRGTPRKQKPRKLPLCVEG
jgi:hypothetical protein